MDGTETKELRAFIRRIVRLAPRATQRRFLSEGPKGFLDLQAEIATLQREIQVAINAAKKATRADKSRFHELRDLRIARWYSKRLGDALAWLTFLYDRKTLVTLANNSRTPNSPTAEDDGSRGVMLTAQSLLDQKWGLPIIHDITDCLRIGDISFLSVPTVDERQIRTVEVKTTRTDAKPQPDGSDLVTLKVTMIATEPFFDSSDHVEPKAAPVAEPPVEAKTLRQDRRLDKQVERMTRAMQYRNVENDVIAEVDGNPHISLLTGVEDVHHWAELRRAIREARENGYAYFSVDEFTGYSIHYSATGVTTDDIQRGNLPDDIVQTIFSPEQGDRNSITLSQLPAKEDDDHAPFMLPFYLYDIPQRAIREMIEGKLMIMAYMNSGRVERALAEAGFTVEPKKKDGKDTRSFRITTTLTWPEGSTNIEIPAPWLDMWTAMHEFYGIDSVISKVEAIRDIPNRVPFSSFEESWKKTYGELARDSNPPEATEEIA